METKKTDLTHIMTVSGERGLFEYISAARNGAILEALDTKKRHCFDAKSKITSLYDISIYTTEEEVRLQQVFLNMKEELKDELAPSQKSDPAILKGFFAKVLPNYDQDRFYVSHMKKVVEWYNILKNFATIDFVDHENNETENNQSNEE